MKTVITYKNADLDCVASAYAYSEFLNKTGQQSSYYISGVVQKEVDIVAALFNIELDRSERSLEGQDIVVVDTNTYSSIDFVDKSQIVEVIDHHPLSEDVYENATMDIQQIGAVCTIIAEKFKERNIGISREAAILLYYGIVSNTVNFKSKVTTDRDREISEWLKTQCRDIDETLIERIFREKSKFDLCNLREAMEVEEAFKLGDQQLIIGQLELVDAEDFLMHNKARIDEVCDAVKEEKNIPTIFINIIDILNGYHIIYTPYEKTQNFLHDNYGLSFGEDQYKEPAIVLRKEIKKALKEKK